jgi:hypothetical protein
VPHNKLLNKLDEYGVRGSINNWLQNFLAKRKMKVVIVKGGKDLSISWYVEEVNKNIHTNLC